jgi:hypothetical protein
MRAEIADTRKGEQIERNDVQASVRDTVGAEHGTADGRQGAGLVSARLHRRPVLMGC